MQDQTYSRIVIPVELQCENTTCCNENESSSDESLSQSHDEYGSELKEEILVRLRERRLFLLSELESMYQWSMFNVTQRDFFVKERVISLKKGLKEYYSGDAILIGYGSGKYRYAVITQEFSRNQVRNIQRIDVYFGDEKEYSVRVPSKYSTVTVDMSCDLRLSKNDRNEEFPCEYNILIFPGGVVEYTYSQCTSSLIHDYDYNVCYHICYDGDVMLIGDRVTFQIYPEIPDLSQVSEERDINSFITEFTLPYLHERKSKDLAHWNTKYGEEMKSLEEEIYRLESCT